VFVKVKIVNNPALRILFLISGSISLILGIIGLIMPVMPGAVFLVVAAACFVRSSEKMYQALLNNKFLGKFVRDYAEKGIISPQLKIIGAITLVMPVISSIVIFSLK
jgi:uncharacterized membrane protein YbaN (DUF454 family)